MSPTALKGALTILVQPRDTTVPLGQMAVLTVNANGPTAISYQWSKNGVAIPGATQDSYSSPPVQTSDSGDVYSVVVSDAVSTLQSRNAVVSIGPRWPADGDLRFQQVGAATTRQSYISSIVSDQNGPGFTSLGGQFGSPLALGPGCSGGPGGKVEYCDYLIYGFSSSDSAPLTALYKLDYLENFQTFLYTNSVPNIVITGINFTSDYDEFGASWLKTTNPAGFDFQQHTVQPSDLLQVIQQEGANSRVVTAIAFNGSSLTYLSYGWSGDRSTTYDETVMTVPFAGTAQAATQLAQQGYIITAIGGSVSDGVLLVGSKVHGDSIPRPIFTSSVGPDELTAQSYAMVGLLVLPNGTPSLFIGEK